MTRAPPAAPAISAGERRERLVVGREPVDQQDRRARAVLRVRQVDARSGDDRGHGYD